MASGEKKHETRRKHRIKRETVNAALAEYVQRRKQQQPDRAVWLVGPVVAPADDGVAADEGVAVVAPSLCITRPGSAGGERPRLRHPGSTTRLRIFLSLRADQCGRPVSSLAFNSAPRN